MSTNKPVKNAKSSGEVGKTAIQVVERMMNLLDALAEHCLLYTSDAADE